MCSCIPHLADELHVLIAQYLCYDDLRNYRLANKLLCAIGTVELFGTVTFHYSTSSFRHLRHISEHDHLRKHVKTIIWDINLWRIPNVRDLHEWERYFSGKARILRQRCDSASSKAHALRLELLGQNRQEWLEYLDKVKDEKEARVDTTNLNVLQRFYNLRAIHIVHGKLIPAHRGVRKMDNEVQSALAEPPVLYRGEGMNDLHNNTGEEAFRSIHRITNPRLRKLKLDRVHYMSFIQLPAGDFANLKSLDVKIAARCDGPYGPVFARPEMARRVSRFLHKGVLRLFLVQLHQLECLKVDLDYRHGKDKFSSRLSLPNVQYIFGSDFKWPRLRKLSLCYFIAAPDTLIALLERHSSTLRDLRLRNIVLDDRIESTSSSGNDALAKNLASSVVTTQGRGWAHILQHLADSLNLHSATLSGQFDTNLHYQKAWNLDKDPEFATAISRYLACGGQCPF
jgi:hypothetical protein